MNNPSILKSKILVTGGDGVVAGYVKNAFDKANVILAGKKYLDVSNKREVNKIINKTKPNIIIHLAAITNVDLCEKDNSLAEKVNFIGTENITYACKENNIPMIYISTSAVFDGRKRTGYSEQDIPSPCNFYARTKYLGEQAILKNLKKFLIVRAGWMIGGGNKDKKFLSFIKDKIKKGETIKVVSDKFGTITYARDLIDFIKKRMLYSEYGLYHFGSKGICSRYDIALVVKDIINKNSKVIPVYSHEFRDKFPAPRPKYEVIHSTKIDFKKKWNYIIREYFNNEIL